LDTVPSAESSFKTNEDFLNFLNEKRSIQNETLRVRLRYLTAQNKDPKQDTECKNLLADIEKAQNTMDLYKCTLPLPETSTSASKGNESNTSKDKKDLSKLHLTNDMPHYKDGQNP
jgi:hypothetical protein